MSITDPNMNDKFVSTVEEFQNTLLNSSSDIVDITTEVSQSQKQFAKSTHDACLKKTKDDEVLFETIQTFEKDLQQIDVVLKDKQHATTQELSEIEEKEMQKREIIKRMEKYQEEQNKRKELIESQNKANKARLKNLGKSRLVFQDRLGLEIRTILGKSETDRGKTLQFIFRNINPADKDKVYIITLGLKEDKQYQILSSDPVLEGLPYLESRLQETNNFSAFLANVRKEFVSRARH